MSNRFLSWLRRLLYSDGYTIEPGRFESFLTAAVDVERLPPRWR